VHLVEDDATEGAGGLDLDLGESGVADGVLERPQVGDLRALLAGEAGALDEEPGDATEQDQGHEVEKQPHGGFLSGSSARDGAGGGEGSTT